jgi:lysine/ornithine N-monooxygenase
MSTGLQTNKQRKVTKASKHVPKYAKWPYNIPNGQKHPQTAEITVKYANISNTSTAKIYPNWDFWYANMLPSGYPALQ